MNSPQQTPNKPATNPEQTPNKPRETAGTTPKSRLNAYLCYAICSEQQKISNMYNTCTVKNCPFRKKENPPKTKGGANGSYISL